MSRLELMSWDTNVLGIQVARVLDVQQLPSRSELDSYDLVVAKLPMASSNRLEPYQKAGFDFVSLDMTMLAHPVETTEVSGNTLPIIWVSKDLPSFAIDGFHVEDSRLMQDVRCKVRLPSGFWDSVISEHCASYSDKVACALSEDHRKIIGIVSCFVRHNALDLFLIAVHPNYQSLGVGKQLMSFVARSAFSEGLPLKTQVLITNTRALDFYTRQGFFLKTGEFVMHRWTTRA